MYTTTTYRISNTLNNSHNNKYITFQNSRIVIITDI